MIHGTLLFSQAAKWPALTAFFQLPDELRPTTVSIGEDDIGEPIKAGDDLHRLLGWRSGFFLNGPQVDYNVGISNPTTIKCNCYMNVQPRLAEDFLVHMSTARPLFAYLCTPGEEDARNRTRDAVGVGTIESWVGRDIERYVPGLYWLTLLPDALAAKHGVPIRSIADLALEYRELGDGQHLFRFYDDPEDWRKTDKIARFCSSTPGIFNIEYVKSVLKDQKSVLAYADAARPWR